MQFIPIFNSQEQSELWSVCYPEHQTDNHLKDIYSILMDDLWSNVSYLLNFIENEIAWEGFDVNFWNGINVQQLIDKIQDEIYEFDRELYQVDLLKSVNVKRSLDKIFIKLHQNIYSLNTLNDSHRKARPNISKSIIRLYGIELSDKTIVITGGALKLRLKMVGSYFDHEIKNLKRVQSYLKSQGIVDRKGLID